MRLCFSHGRGTPHSTSGATLMLRVLCTLLAAALTWAPAQSCTVPFRLGLLGVRGGLSSGSFFRQCTRRMLVGGGLPNAPSGTSGATVPGSLIGTRALGLPALTMMCCWKGAGSARSVLPMLLPSRQLPDSRARSAMGATMRCRLPDEARRLRPPLAALVC